MQPLTRYARNGDINIAYQVIGEGERDLVLVPGWVTNVEVFWENPWPARFLTRLSTFSRLILFDKRGTGLSDRVEIADLETRMDDVRAVMDAVGSERAAIVGYSEGASMSMLFAATYPARTSALVIVGGFARRTWAPDYPCGLRAEEWQIAVEQTMRDWGGALWIDSRAPSLAHDRVFRDWWARFLRLSASPGANAALLRMNAEIDLRRVLPGIRVPTLIVHNAGDSAIPVEH